MRKRQSPDNCYLIIIMHSFRFLNLAILFLLYAKGYKELMQYNLLLIFLHFSINLCIRKSLVPRFIYFIRSLSHLFYYLDGIVEFIFGCGGIQAWQGTLGQRTDLFNFLSLNSLCGRAERQAEFNEIKEILMMYN